MLLLYLFSLASGSSESSIYIPLCFYFIDISFFRLFRHDAFTFHYASTLSIRGSLFQMRRTYLHSTMLLLYQRWLRASLYRIQHLHSTMLLLYPYRVVCPECVSHIYIPLCFYFIRDFQSRFPCDLIYLHSTMLLLYLLRFRLSTACSSNLHSTMLLLYRSRCSLCVDRKDIYIPLCFYFIQMTLRLPQLHPPHLHSTMLLLYLSEALLTLSSKTYLHSTMLLLYRRTCNKCR